MMMLFFINRTKQKLNEKGFGTVEIVILIAILVGIALIFREAITNFVASIVSNMFPDDTSIFNNSGK